MRRAVLDLGRVQPGNVFHLVNSAKKRLNEIGAVAEAVELNHKVFPDKEARPTFEFALSVVRQYCDVVGAVPAARPISESARHEMDEARDAHLDPEHGANTGL